LEQNRNKKDKSTKLFLFSTKNINILLFVLLCCIGIFAIFSSHYGNLIVGGISEKNIANAQSASSTESSNIVDLKVSERNNNYVWTSANGQVNPQLNLKSDKDYTIQVESRDNNVSHQLILQDQSGKQLAKSIVISNGITDDFPFTFSNIGKYQYHCQYHPATMHGDIVVS
jgi:plastocyanin